MIIKKTLLALFLGIAVFSIAGCAGGEQSGEGTHLFDFMDEKDKDLDEATIRKLCAAMSPKADDKEKERAYPLQELPAAACLNTSMINGVANIMNEMRQGTNLEDIKVYDIQQDGNHGSANISCTNAGQTSMFRMNFLRINGKWCINFLGIKDGGPVKISGYDKAAVKIEGTIGHTFAGDTVIILDMQSLTNRSYSAGWVEPMQAVLITDQGEFPIRKVEDAIGPAPHTMISSHQPARLALPFAGAKGQPKQLRLIGFNALNSRGLPVNIGEAQVLTLNIDSIEIVKSADNLK